MNLMKWRWLYVGISLLFIIPGLVSLILFGLKPAIDFTGGSLLEVRFIQVDEDVQLTQDELKAVLNDVYQLDSVQQSGSNQLILKGKEMPNEQKNLVMESITTKYGEVEELRFETVGPALGRELLMKTLMAVAIAATLIMVYVWTQFDEIKFGVAAILAMFHDSLILLGIFSLLGWFAGIEVDILFVTALLTTLSFSVHDTIVVFDRIRELKRKHVKVETETVVDAAVIETLSRSINNSVTIIIMLVALSLLGGDTIRWFAVALLIGAITGTYSSTFIAAPLLLFWDELAQKIKSRRRRQH